MHIKEVGAELMCAGCIKQFTQLQKEFESTRELVRQLAAAQLKMQAQIENGLLEDNDQWDALREVEDTQAVLVEFRDGVLAFHKDMKFHARIKELEAATNIIQELEKK